MPSFRLKALAVFDMTTPRTKSPRRACGWHTEHTPGRLPVQGRATPARPVPQSARCPAGPERPSCGLACPEHKAVPALLRVDGYAIHAARVTQSAPSCTPNCSRFSPPRRRPSPPRPPPTIPAGPLLMDSAAAPAISERRQSRNPPQPKPLPCHRHSVRHNNGALRRPRPLRFGKARWGVRTLSFHAAKGGSTSRCGEMADAQDLKICRRPFPALSPGC